MAAPAICELRGNEKESSLRERPFAILPGQYFDAETGLHQNWNRDYDPSIGRYLQSDPLGLDAGLSTYGYANANPLAEVDPNGLLSCSYRLREHTLYCENNLGQFFMTKAVKSGDGKCQDNTACTGTKNQGPLPPGYYVIHPPGTYDKTHVPKNPKTWLWLEDPQNQNSQNRAGFYIHGWGISNGCIAIRFNATMNLVRQWAAQDGGGDLWVSE